MKLWLDDMRPAPEGWHKAVSVNRAIHLIKQRHHKFTDLSLDHDLGKFAFDGGDGVKLVLWMAEHNMWPRNKPTVHSMNPVGRHNMEALIERYFTERG